MKASPHGKISTLQYIVFIHSAQIGIGVLAVPRELAVRAGTDGWISMLLGWGITLAVSLIVVQALKRYPHLTFPELMKLAFGRVVGTIIQGIMCGYFAYMMFVVMLFTAEIMRTWILDLMPNYTLIGLLALPTFYLLSKDLHVLARFAVLVFLCSLWAPFFLLILLRESHWVHLLPVLKEGVLPVVQGVPSTIISFLGFETVFIFFPYLQNPQAATKGVIIANLLSLFIYMLVLVLCFLTFSPDEISTYRWPGLNMLKSIEFRFLVRVEMILLSLYLFVLFRTWTIYFHCMLACVPRISNFLMPTSLLLVVCFSKFYSPSALELSEYQRWLKIVGVWLVYAFPLFLALYLRLFRRKPRGELT